MSHGKGLSIKFWNVIGVDVKDFWIEYIIPNDLSYIWHYANVVFTIKKNVIFTKVDCANRAVFAIKVGYSISYSDLAWFYWFSHGKLTISLGFTNFVLIFSKM